MGTEVERKFIVPLQYHEQFLNLPPGINQIEMIQAYLSSEKGKTVRLRIERRAYTLSSGSTRWYEDGWITIKGPSKDGGLTRSEWEEKFPFDTAKDIIKTLNPPRLEKTRNLVSNGEDIWDVDVLKVCETPGRPPNTFDYLVVAEYEHQDSEKVKNVRLPDWIGKEVTSDHRFSMSNLVTEDQRHLAWSLAYRNNLG
jgi:CYTH domain-containing protein